MTEPQAYERMLRTEEEEEEAESNFHELLDKFAPPAVGGRFSSGDPSVLDELLAAESKLTEKRHIADSIRKA